MPSGRFLPTRLRAISIYSVETEKSVQVTDGMSDARFPAFDRDGQYLYFTASTNYGPTSSGLDMTSDEHDVTRSVYLIVLPNNIGSPLAPESDEEKPGEPRPAAEGRGGEGGEPPPRGDGPAKHAPIGFGKPLHPPHPPPHLPRRFQAPG